MKMDNKDLQKRELICSMNDYSTFKEIFRFRLFNILHTVLSKESGIKNYDKVKVVRFYLRKIQVDHGL